MRRGIEKYYKNTFVRYIVSHALLLTLLLLCVITFMHTYTRKALYESTRGGEINKLVSVRAQFENYFDRMTYIVRMLSASEESEPFSLADAPQRAYKLRALLNACAAANDFSDPFYVRFYADEYLHSASYSISIEEFTQREISYEFLNAQQLAQALSRGEDMRVLECQAVAKADGEPARALTFIMPFRLESADAQGDIVFIVPEERYGMLMDDEATVERNRYVMHNGEIILASENLPLNQNFAWQSSLADGDIATQVRRVAGREYLFIIAPEDARGFSYLTVISLSDIYRAAAGGWLRVVLTLMLFAAPCLALTILISRANYRPIRALRQALSEGDTYAKEDDLYAIRAGVDNLINRNRALNDILRASQPARGAKFALDVVKGRLRAREEIIRAAADAGIDADRRCLAVIITGGALGDIYGADADLLRGSAPARLSFACSESAGAKHTLIVAFADDERHPREFADALYAHAPCALSGVHDLCDAPDAFAEAVFAYEHRFTLGGSRAIAFEDIPAKALNTYSKSRGFTEAVRQALANGDNNMLYARMDDLKVHIAHTDMSYIALKLIYCDVLAAILSQMDARVSRELGDPFDMSECLTYADLDARLRRLAHVAISGAREDDQQPLVKHIIAYMAENFADQALSLTAVADKFALSTTRLSVLFKDNMHMTPSDYLTMLRMEHSKKLLKQTDMSIKDICAAVGYFDVSSYIRRFKQYAGITPLQYRQGAQQ